MLVKKAAVVGAGVMGGQIAQTIAAAGVDVLLKDVRQELVDRGLQEARTVTAGTFAKQVDKGRLTDAEATAKVDEVMGRIHGTTTYDGFGDVDFVIEAVPERIEIKQAVFGELDAVTPGHAILASNTSGLSITEIGEATLRPERIVGFHYFYPAAVMPLIEIIEGEETAPETVQAATIFAQAIRKTPITCAEVPGFVVNRILMSGLSEVWRLTEEQDLSIKAVDELITAAKVSPMGPYFLVDLLGLDTTFHVAHHMLEAYGEERFYVHEGMATQVAAGKLGAKTGGEGFYLRGEPVVGGKGVPQGDEIARLLRLKTFTEAALVLQEDVATHRDIDVGMMAGAGLDPRRGLCPPFMQADMTGLDVLLEELEAAAAEYGPAFAPPRILRRLVAQGRLGRKSGQGFYAYPQPDAEQPAGDGAVVLLETRGDVAIAWLANGPMNALSPTAIAHLTQVYEAAKAGGARAVLLASSNPLVFCAGADIKAFGELDETTGPRFFDDAHALLRSFETDPIVTLAAINGLAFGGGCEIVMACDVRLAARSASFGQPEIKLGIVPGFGGTQRLPRLVGENKALEMNLLGDPISATEAFEFGLVNRLVPDHELFDAALAWAQRVAAQAPLAVAQIKAVSSNPDLDAGIAAEKAAIREVFPSADAQEGIAAFLAKRAPVWQGR